MKKNLTMALFLGLFALLPLNANANNMKKMNNNSNKKMTQMNKNGISFEQAAMIAAKKAGAHPSQVVELKKDFERGREVYEGKIYNKGFEYEFEIDVLTGKIVKWDVDRD